MWALHGGNDGIALGTGGHVMKCKTQSSRKKKSTKKEKALGWGYKEERKFNGTERAFLYQEVFIRERTEST